MYQRRFNRYGNGADDTNAAPQLGQGPPPGLSLPFREYSRYDYYHDSYPSFIPNVREYEHGVRDYGGIPVFNPHVPPPPIVTNSVSNNPILFDNFHQQAHSDLSFNDTTFQAHRRDVINRDSPSSHAQIKDQPHGFSELFTMYKSLESKLKVMEEENIKLKINVSEGPGEAVPMQEHLEGENQDLVDPTNGGK